MNRRRSNAGLALFSVLSLAAAAAIVTYSVSVDLRPSSTLPWACLPVLVLAVAAAQAFQVDVTGPTSPARFTLVTATVAPLIYGYGIATVAAAVALGHLPGMFGGSLRRMRGLTLMARWTFSATVGATVAELLGVATELTPAVAASIVLSLAVISVVNLGWLLVEAAITDPASWPYAIRKPVFLAAVIAVHWVVNSLFGLLFVFALAGSPLGVLLVPVPLLLIFVTARLYTDAYADRGRVETLSEASRILSEPVDPMTAIRPFLEEIRERFGARTAALVMVSEDHRPTAFRWSADGTYEDEVPVNPLERRLVKSGVLTRVSASDNSALARLLREDGAARASPRRCSWARASWASSCCTTSRAPRRRPSATRCRCWRPWHVRPCTRSAVAGPSRRSCRTSVRWPRSCGAPRTGSSPSTPAAR